VAVATKRILLVEDEVLVAMLLQSMLEDLGYVDVERVGRVEAAIDMVNNNDFALAIVDVNLHGEKSFPVADALIARAIPFYFATGYDAISDPRYAGIPLISKPFDIDELKTILDRCL
jgi:DNA-binding response OmpR family regulator